MESPSPSGSTYSTATVEAHLLNHMESADEPPLYTINLSLPPKERYAQICADFKDKLANLAAIYDDAIAFLGLSRFSRFLLNNLILRRLHSREENEEVHAIATLVEMPIHLAVAYNTLLDLFSGCMSAGVRVTDAGDGRNKLGMVHLRGLDWDMEPLRELIIRVEYVKEGVVIARAVTYAGYTGVLTGVREGLSISFNYRASIVSASPILKHRIHQLLMLLGLRQSAPSHLRRILLSPGPAQSLDDITRWITHPNTRLSSCYLTFCSPSSVLVVERDLAKARTQTSTVYRTVTNHDVDIESLTQDERLHLYRKSGFNDESANAIVEDSVDRKESMIQLIRGSEDKGEVRRTMRDVKLWLETEPIKNETTHFSCIMDPSVKGGGLVWVQKYHDTESS